MDEIYFQVYRAGPRASELSIALPHALAVLASLIVLLAGCA